MSTPCRHYETASCRSCGWLPLAYPEQLERKQAAVAALLSGYPELGWEAPQPSPLFGFRNKAKLAVGGSCEAPTLGVLDSELNGVDLPGCLLYPAPIMAALPAIRRAIERSRLTPYDARRRRGELKYVLILAAPQSDQLMLRWVLRSRESLGRLQRDLPALLSELPGLRVVSVNLQPLPAALVEGEQELPLFGEALPMPVNGLQLQLRPGGFFQTNAEVAAALYRSARAWTAELPIRRVLDLYCGIGGFALHLARPGWRVRGIEHSAAAVASAQAAVPAGAEVVFEVGDATALAEQDIQTDLLVVNPPRRGLGATLCQQIVAGNARWLLYSSCNPASLAADLQRLPGFRPRRGQVFDMFPHTPHAELLLLLERSAGGMEIHADAG